MIEGRLGFCCQLLLDDPADQAVSNMRTTTMAWLARQTPADAYDRLAEIARHNLDALDRQIAFVAALPREERMFRMLSGMFPGWSHPTAEPYWRDTDLRALIDRRLAKAGEAARTGDVRLAMHPGQHAVIATLRPDAFANSVRDLRDHHRQMALMGYGGGWHPHGAFVNVHGGSGQAGVEGLKAGLAALPQDILNLLTIENDEHSFGLDDLLHVADQVALVVDFHHHWVHSGGEYLEPEDRRVSQLKASWRGTRPAAHISVSPEDIFDELPQGSPDYPALFAAGHKKGDLRRHSQMMWNAEVNDLVARHLVWTDVEVEAKAKNLASRQLADHVRAMAD